MRALFLQLNICTKRGQDHMYQVGVGSIMSQLRDAGHDVRFSSVVSLEPGGLDVLLRDFQPQLVGVYVVAPMQKYLGPAARIVKEQCPGAFLLAGGPHVTISPDCLEHMAEVDAGFRGEGEPACLELARRLEQGLDWRDMRGMVYRKDGTLVGNPLPELITEAELRSYSAPWRGPEYQACLDAHPAKIAHFIFSRGCPFKCAYCSNEAFNKLFGYLPRWRSVDQALAEVEDVLARFDVGCIGFDDDIITLNKPWFESFFTQYRDCIKVPFYANLRVGTARTPEFQLLREAGCLEVQMGIESGDPHIRQQVLGRRMSDQEIEAAFHEAHSVGLRTMSFNMVGLPYETEERFMNTVRMNARIQPNSPGLHVFYPYKGTTAWDICSQNNWIGREDDTLVEREDTILSMPEFPRERILECFRTFHERVHQESEALAAAGQQ